MIHYTYFDSPIQTILLTAEHDALTGLYMVEHKHSREIDTEWIEEEQAVPFPEAKRQLSAYFAGNLTDFDLPLAPRGTSFQQLVWAELQRIPYGTTLTYGELAARISNPKASRAVGLANGRNPLSIVIPCHRVIGANGKLVGYGGGLARKEMLLSLEAGTCPEPVLQL